MANRYLNLFKLPEHLYAKNSPIIIEAGALHKDLVLGDIVVQLKFRSLVSQKIVSVTVDITCFNVAKEIVTPSFVYQYNNIAANENEPFFAHKTLITLPDNDTRSFNVKIINVEFNDGSIYVVDSNEWKTIPQQTEISTHGDIFVKYFQSKFGNTACVEPAFFEDLWLCTCRQENKQENTVCLKCSAAYYELFPFDIEEESKKSIYDLAIKKISLNLFSEAITLFESISGWQDVGEQIVDCQRKIEEIKAKEEAERLEKERKAEIDRKEAERIAKRNKKIAIIVTPIACIIFVFLIVLAEVIIPNGKYNEAIALLDEGEYTEAAAAFEELGDYKDSANKVTECQYNAAVALLDEGKYTEAAAAFEELGDYKDSANKINEYQYNAAVALMDASKYDEAISAFEALEGYKDSTTKINECNSALLDTKYNNAIALMKGENIIEAYEALIALDGYKDSTKKADSIYDKYKTQKLKVAKVGDYVFFGAYEQDNNPSNGKEDVEWLVLEAKGRKALVISKYALNCKQYNTSFTDVTWETCSLRKWLNSDFINTAFSADEKAMIPTVTVSADKKPKFSTNPGNATQDQVFLLSITEANKYFNSDSERQCKLTDYALANSAWSSNKGNCRWWLRSPGDYWDCAACVNRDGDVGEHARRVDDSDYAVRPALWIDLNS